MISDGHARSEIELGSESADYNSLIADAIAFAGAIFRSASISSASDTMIMVVTLSAFRTMLGIACRRLCIILQFGKFLFQGLDVFFQMRQQASVGGVVPDLA